MKWTRTLVFALVLSGGVCDTAEHAFGNTEVHLNPYTTAANSAFDTTAFGYCIETFEDGSMDVPGVQANGVVIGPGGNTDSVDGDDGAIDGSGTNGRSLHIVNGAAGLEIIFDPSRTNGLPTEAGIVWTDGAGEIAFQAFDANGLKFANAGGSFSDGKFDGGTSEDRYFGVFDSLGISKVTVSNSIGDMEVDHLQLDHCIVCGDTNFDLHVSATDALTTLRVAVGIGTCDPCVCDVDNNQKTSATDALAILKKAVGLSPTMKCPACNLD